MSANHALLVLLATEAKEQAAAMQHVDVRQTRFHKMREYVPADTLQLGFRASCLETWNATRQEILSDPGGELHLRLAALFGRGDAEAESFLRRLKENTAIDGVPLYFRQGTSVSEVEAIFDTARVDAIRVDPKSRAPTLMLFFPCATIDALGADGTIAGLTLPVRRGWQLLAQWYKDTEPDATRFVAEFDFRYNEPALELWLRLIPWARVPPFLRKRHLQPRKIASPERTAQPEHDPETDDADDEDDGEAKPSVVLPSTTHAEEK